MFDRLKRIPSFGGETDGIDLFNCQRPFVRGITRLLPIIFFGVSRLEVTMKALQNIFEIHSAFQRLGDFAYLAVGPVLSKKSQRATETRYVQQALVTKHKLAFAPNVDQTLVGEDE